MSEPRKQYLAVKGFYSLMIRAQKYKMAYRAADAVEAADARAVRPTGHRALTVVVPGTSTRHKHRNAGQNEGNDT